MHLQQNKQCVSADELGGESGKLLRRIQWRKVSAILAPRKHGKNVPLPGDAKTNKNHANKDFRQHDERKQHLEAKRQPNPQVYPDPE